MLIFDRLTQRDLPLSYRVIAIDIPLLAGLPEIARETAKNLVEKEQWTQWRWWNYIVDFHAGELSEKQLLELAGPFSNTTCMAKYAVAVRAVADGDRPKALEFFSQVRETKRIAWFPYDWGSAFASRMEGDSGWGSWVRAKRSGAASSGPQVGIE